MKQLDVFNKIGGIIKELNDQYKYIENNPADLNDLELELFIANAHFLADYAEILGKLSSKTKADKPAEPKKPSTEKYFEPVVRQSAIEAKPKITPNKSSDEPPAEIDIAAAAPEDSYSFIIEEPEVIRHELVVDEADWDEENENEEQPLENEEQVPEKEVEPVPAKPSASLKDAVKYAAKKAADTKDEVYTINQKISDQMGGKTAIGEKMIEPPVSDLKQAITLNDKLLYIKDLFNGYNLAYSEAIEILNRFNSFDEAERFLNKNYVTKNDWAGKPDTTAKFYGILKRRYA